MLRNYTGGATNSKEAPEMAEVKFGLCINHEEDIFMYQLKTLTLGTKTISTIFAQVKTNKHAFKIGLYLLLDFVVW